MATIYDIAKKTGFSPPTVSRALSGSGTLSERTRSLIRETAKEMGYVPNLTARTLSTRCSHLIGIINANLYQVDVFSPPIYNNILGGFKQVLETQGYDMLLLSRFLENYRNIDGILIMSIHLNDYERLLHDKHPCVSVNDSLPKITQVVTANYRGAKTAVQYLIDLGHRKIAYIGGQSSLVSKATLERQQGYQDCLEENNIPLKPSLIESTDSWQALSGFDAVKRLLRRAPDITAIFAASDALAYGAIKAMHAENIKIPEDVSIIGFDGDVLGEYINPALTTMKQDAILIGQTAGELMLKKIAKQECEDIIRIDAELNIRESCCRR
ncbi:MAG: LacI family transcriptional regulator [Treponema sp.]|nr:LacI family transcriptional regulator [Treponema sp.]